MIFRKTFLLPFFLLFGALCHSQTDISTIIQKHGEAIGGLDQWRAVNSYIIKMESERETGSYIITSTMLRPYSFRLDFLNDDLIKTKSYDGNDGWISENGMVYPMSAGEEVEMREEGSFYEELAFSREKNITLNYLGIEVKDEQKYHKIEMIKSEEDKQTYYVNAETYLIDIVSEYSEDKEFDGVYFTTKMMDYQDFDGIMLPTYMELYANEKRLRTYKIESVQINVEVNQNTFSKPNPWLNDAFKEKLNQFDFWLGEWDVYNYGTDTLVGRSIIEKAAAGFGIKEAFYAVPGPFHGNSLNKYNFFTQQWEQFWIDNSGMSHFFTGTYTAGEGMVLSKEEPRGNDTIHHRLIIKPIDHDQVRQTWYQNETIAFDATYRKRLSVKYDMSSNQQKSIEASGDLIQQLLKATNIPGLSIAVDLNNKVVWNEGFGYSNLELKTEVNNETKFRIASISKLLTGTLIGKLWDESRLDLDAPLSMYLDSIPDAWKQITLQQLAEHSSGIPHYSDVADALDTREYKTTRSALAKFSDRSLSHPPGRGKTYSSYAYTVFAHMLEQHFKKPFTELIEEELLLPTDMRHTLPDYQQKLTKNRTGYYQFGHDDSVENAPYINLSGRWAGSGYLSTSSDLVRFGAQHYDGSGFLSTRALDRITSIRQLQNVKLNEGLGWGPRTGYEGRKMLFGDGSTPGATGGLLVFPDQKVSVSLLTNIRSAPINRGELQSIAHPFVLASEGKEVKDLPRDIIGKHQLEIEVGGQKLHGLLAIEQVGPTRGSLELSGLQSFTLAGGYAVDDDMWIYAISDGRGPMALGILPMRMKLNAGKLHGTAFRIDGVIIEIK